MRAWWAIALVGVLGCDPEGEPAEDPDVTWHADIRPAVQRHCVRCHQPDGVGPIDFSTYESASLYASIMPDRIHAGEMPPPASDPACRDYHGSERLFIDDETTALFERWEALGAPEGDPANAPDEVDEPPELSRVDLEVTVDAPYTAEFTDDNRYRCFILDHGQDEDFYITGMDAAIDNTRISHHTILFLAPDGDADKYVTDEATRSWTCPSVQPDWSWSFLHAWAPGNNPAEFPSGMGMPIGKDQQLVLQMHYYDPGDAEGVVDQPGYRFSTASSVTKTMYMFGLGPTSFRIPAGDDSFTRTARYNPSDLAGFPIAVDVHGAAPHMHVLGKGYDVWVEDEQGNETCVASGAWDFDNQPTYMFKEPVTIPAHGAFGVSCTWDNSASNPNQLHDPPVDVRFGERTDEEMCFSLTYFSVSG